MEIDDLTKKNISQDVAEFTCSGERSGRVVNATPLDVDDKITLTGTRLNEYNGHKYIAITCTGDHPFISLKTLVGTSKIARYFGNVQRYAPKFSADYAVVSAKALQLSPVESEALNQIGDLMNKTLRVIAKVKVEDLQYPVTFYRFVVE